MKRAWIVSIIFAITIHLSSRHIDAKRLRLRPMSADEVYRVLREAGREDVIPQGRIITQGIAAVSGLAVGLKKGIAGSQLYQLVASNATQEYLNNMNLSNMFSGYNFTGTFNGLTENIVLPTWNFTLPEFNYTLPCIFNKWNISSLRFGNCNTGSANTVQQYTTQEICFNTRSLNDIEDDGGVDNDNAAIDDYDEALARQATPTTPATTTSGIGTSDAVSSPTTAGNTGTLISDTTTETDNNNSINCIVIQTPVQRHRYRRRRHRRSTNSRLKAILGVK